MPGTEALAAWSVQLGGSRSSARTSLGESGGIIYELPARIMGPLSPQFSRVSAVALLLLLIAGGLLLVRGKAIKVIYYPIIYYRTLRVLWRDSTVSD